MAKFKCQLCNQIFANGKAFVVHMNAHHASPSHPPKPPIRKQKIGFDVAESSSSSPSSSSSVEEEENKKQINSREVEEKAFVYGLRENPKKSVKIADPDFSFAVDERKTNESESELRNPTGVRSKRARKLSLGNDREHKFDIEKVKPENNLCSVKSPADEQERRMSLPGATPEVLEAGATLMMMRRDVWRKKNEERGQEQSKDRERSVESSKKGVKFLCERCRKQFQSPRALAGHKKSCSMKGLEARNAGKCKKDDADKKTTFECPYCPRVFGSGQALGGHKRSHLVNSPKTDSSAVTENSPKRGTNATIDLNLPAPTEDDELNVFSDD